VSKDVHHLPVITVKENNQTIQDLNSIFLTNIPSLILDGYYIEEFLKKPGHTKKDNEGFNPHDNTYVLKGLTLRKNKKTNAPKDIKWKEEDINKISDLCKNLEELTLKNNPLLTKVSTLDSCVALKTLSLDSNFICNIESIDLLRKYPLILRAEFLFSRESDGKPFLRFTMLAMMLNFTA
jgi:hypothetical protein